MKNNRNYLSVLSAAVVATLLSGCGDDQQPKTNAEVKEAATEQVAAEMNAATAARSSGVNLENFDQSVRPQDDFFRHVNGAWIDRTEIPADRNAYGSFTVLAEQAQENLRTIIEESATADNLTVGSDEQKVGDLYNAVLDVVTLDKRGVEPLNPLLANIDAIENKQQLIEYFANATRVRSASPFSYYINNDSKDPNAYIMYLSQSGIGLPNRDYYFDDDEKNQSIREQYIAHIERMFTLAKRDNASSAAKDIMALETAIANAHWDKVRNRDRNATYNKLTLNEVDQLSADFDWDLYFKTMGVDNEKNIIVRQPTYLSDFNTIFKDTALESWKSYLAWHLIRGNASILSSEIDEANFDFYGRTLRGTPQQQPRWKRGVNAVNGLLGEVVGKVYVKKHFKPEAKQRMVELVENLRKAYHNSILELDWMGEETKKQALDKLAKFTPKIGYPDKWQDYSALTIEKGKLFESYMAASNFNVDYNLNKLGKPINRDEWFMTPQTVNAYYNPVMNEIVFPAAILQPPFFDMNADDAVNYGGIGAVIGHEMGHGFDDQGSKSDGDGVLRNWWTESDLTNFKQRTGALADQYSSYEPLPGEFINGDFTLGENIGDLGGLTIAYAAYQLANGEATPAVLDGFTGDQRFFIGWAQVWGIKFRDEALRVRLKTDTHSPGEYRTNGVVRNMPEFYEAFSLKPDDKLFLPEEQRVKIW